MKNPINRKTIANTSLGIGLTAIVTFVLLVIVTQAKGPTGADYQRRTEAVRQIENTESAMGRYFASLNTTNPQAGIEAILAYCKNPTPVEQQKNAEYLCNTLAPQRESFLEAEVTANAIIQEKLDEQTPFGYGAAASLAGGLLMVGAGWYISHRAAGRPSKLQEKPAA